MTLTESHDYLRDLQDWYKCNWCNNWYPKRLETCDLCGNKKIPEIIQDKMMEFNYYLEPIQQ